MLEMTVSLDCECGGPDCTLSVELEFLEAANSQRASIIKLVVESCEVGPSPTDELVEVHDGYSLYER